jgi:MtN3 and saliva related transmembrane protein
LVLSSGEILGLAAGALTTGSFLPQVIRVFKLRSAREISLFFTALVLAGDLVWLAYGIYLKALPLILWNVLAGILVISLLVGKIRYGKISDVQPGGTK